MCERFLVSDPDGIFSSFLGGYNGGKAPLVKGWRFTANILHTALYHIFYSIGIPNVICKHSTETVEGNP